MAFKGRPQVEARASGEVPDGRSRLVRIAGDGEILVEDGPRFIREAATVRRREQGNARRSRRHCVRRRGRCRRWTGCPRRRLSRPGAPDPRSPRASPHGQPGHGCRISLRLSSPWPDTMARTTRRLTAGGIFNASISPLSKTHIAEFHDRRRCRRRYARGLPEQGREFPRRPPTHRLGRWIRARLHELAAFAGPHPENRTAIAVACGLRSMRVQVLEADRNGVFGPQAQFGPAASCVTNMRRRMSSPDKSTNTSAGCSTAGSTRA